MNRIMCWLKTQWYSIPSVLKGSFPIEGHSYKEVFNDGNIQVLKCMDCGNQSASWHELKGDAMTHSKEANLDKDTK